MVNMVYSPKGNQEYAADVFILKVENEPIPLSLSCFLLSFCGQC